MKVAQSIDTLNVDMGQMSVAQAIDALNVETVGLDGLRFRAVSPEDGATGVDASAGVIFDWSDSEGEGVYRLVASYNEDLSSPFLNKVINGTQYQYDNSLVSLDKTHWKLFEQNVIDRPAIVPVFGDKNSVQGDFEALQALYNDTQGQNLTSLPNTSLTGTISVSSGSTTVTGTSTSFLSEVSVNDKLWGYELYQTKQRCKYLGVVTSVDSDTQITLASGSENSISGADGNVINSLPTNTSDVPYPYMYLVDGEIHYLKRISGVQWINSHTAFWVNAGIPWKDKTGWDTMTAETMGDAVGVTTDVNGRVTELDLWRITPRNYGASNPGYTGNNLAGELPAEINNLKQITYLAVKQNFLYGALPDISGLKNITEASLAGQDQYLITSDRNQWHEADHWSGMNIDGGKSIVTTNRFRTDVPAFTNCPNLKTVELRHQFLTGTLPDWTNLPSLEAIFIDSPDDVAENAISGELPTSWGNLTTTVFFNIGGLNLSGVFPATIDDNWENLALCALRGNSFSGPVPQFLKSRDKRYIVLNGNNFTGGFPSGYFNGDNSLMTKWQIGDLFLGGELPQTVPAPTYPTSRSNYAIDAPGIGYNDFSGELPRWYQTMLGMQTFFIRGNQFSGPFPDGLMDQDNLKTFYGDSNNFSGPLPDKQWGNRAIPWFYMNGNSYTGEVPDSWISLFQSDAGNWHTNYQRVYWNDNELSGRIPTWIINTGASHFSIQNNRYTFKDIIPVYDVLNNNIPAFSVFPQKPFGVEQNPIIPVGDSITFDLSEFNYAGNSYQWEKDGVDISGATSSTYSVTNAQESDSGVYKLKVTNSNLPELGTHESQIIDLIVGEDPNEVPQTP